MAVTFKASVSSTRVPATRPPAAMATATSANASMGRPCPEISAMLPRQSAAIFGVSFHPRAKPMSPLVNQWMPLLMPEVVTTAEPAGQVATWPTCNITWPAPGTPAGAVTVAQMQAGEAAGLSSGERRNAATYTIASDANGLTANGMATLLTSTPHFTENDPERPAPMKAPTMEWVVDTGIPKRVARSTQADAAARTATKNALDSGVLESMTAPLNFSTSEELKLKEISDPMIVERVPQRRARRRLASPSRTSVATPFPLSLEPLENARNAASTMAM